MPQVQERTKSNKGTATCNKCRKPIIAGEKYYKWAFRYGPKNTRHVACGRPRQSELTQSKMSGVYAAVEAAEDAIAIATEAADIASALTDAAQGISDVKSEYEDSLSNMPDGLQQGDIGQQIQEKIDELDNFVSTLESAASDIESDEKDEEEDDVDWLEGLKQQASDALSELSI